MAQLPAECDWYALRQLFSSPWFTRLWVVQEVGFAQKGVAHAGEHVVNAEVLTLAARWMVHRSYSRYYDGAEIEGIENASNMDRPSSRPLGNQLRRMHRLRCSDPRDRVYGLLGLLRPAVAAAIVPDYSSRLMDVYARATRVAIEEQQNLDILRFAAWFVDEQRKKSVFSLASNALEQLRYLMSWSYGWPSWVLRFNASTDSANGSCLNVQVFQEPEWQLQTRDVGDPMILSVKGRRLGRITYTSIPFTTSLLQNGRKLATTALQCMNSAGFDHVANVRTYNQLKLTLICGINAQNFDADTDSALDDEFSAFWAWCIASQTGFQHAAQPTPPYVRHMWRARNRRFFLTAEGHMGMAPLMTRKGDFICMLTGTAGVFTLSQMQSVHWRLIGDAYCPTFMASLPLVTSHSSRMPAREQRQLSDTTPGLGEIQKDMQWFDIS